jgi:hypothetical protein
MLNGVYISLLLKALLQRNFHRILLVLQTTVQSYDYVVYGLNLSPLHMGIEICKSVNSRCHDQF